MPTPIPISFHGKVSKLKPINRDLLKLVLHSTAENHGFRIKKVRYILVDDAEILQINNDFLQHDYYTDIITFDLSEMPGKIEAEIYISYDTVLSNSEKFQTSFEHELLRVLFHGMLHLLGFSDKSPKQQKQMRSMEDQCLNLYLKSAGKQ